MNKLIMCGRLCADPEIRFTQGENATCIANFNIAVDKRFKKRDASSDAPTADFFRFTAFGKLGEFCQNYLKKGTKIIVEGRVENNNYTNSDGQKVYGFAFVAENIEFAESKKAAEEHANAEGAKSSDFVSVPESLEAELPFK